MRPRRMFVMAVTVGWMLACGAPEAGLPAAPVEPAPVDRPVAKSCPAAGHEFTDAEGRRWGCVSNSVAKCAGDRWKVVDACDPMFCFGDGTTRPACMSGM